MTNKGLFYRSPHKWRIGVAFVFAGMLHVAALVAASHRQEPAVTVSGPDFVPISVDVVSELRPAEPVPTPEPAFPPISHSEFSELPRRLRFHEAPKMRPATPIRPAGPPHPAKNPNPAALAVSAPKPEYPYEARSRHITGSGVALLEVDPSSGFVRDVAMEQSVGNEMLDEATIRALRRWRFKPGTQRRVRVPITFLLTGVSY